MARVDDDRQVRDLLDGSDGAQIERIARIRLVSAYAALAEYDVVVTAGHDVLRRVEPLADGRGKAALQEYRRMHLADFFEQLEVLHVARTDLDHVGILRDQFDVVDVHDLRHDLEPRLVRRLAQHLQPLFRQSLEIIGRSARLEGTAAQELGAVLLHALGRFHELLHALDSARSRHDRQVPRADLHASDVDDGVFGLELAAYKFVLLRDAHRLFHPVERIHLQSCNDLFVTDHADDRAFIAFRKMVLETGSRDFLLHFLKVFLCRRRTHYNDHDTTSCKINDCSRPQPPAPWRSRHSSETSDSRCIPSRPSAATPPWQRYGNRAS